MKKTISLMLLCLAVVLSSGIVRADDMFVVVGSPATGTKITSLPYDITEPGFYYLADNLSSTSSGITISVNNVTLDLMGFTISGGESSIGVQTRMGKENLVIRNGYVTGFGDSVLCSGNNIRIMHLMTQSPTRWGIVLTGQGNVMEDCHASASGEIGIKVFGTGRLQDSVAYNNGGSGIQVQRGCSVVGNVSAYNTGHGIDIHAAVGEHGSATMIKDNICQNNDMNGINADGSGHNIGDVLIVNNVASSNGGDGIHAEEFGLVHENVCTGNSGADISIPGNTYSNTPGDGVNITGPNAPAP